MKRIRIIDDPNNLNTASRNISLRLYQKLIDEGCDVEIVLVGSKGNETINDCNE